MIQFYSIYFSQGKLARNKIRDIGYGITHFVYYLSIQKQAK